MSKKDATLIFVSVDATFQIKIFFELIFVLLKL